MKVSYILLTLSMWSLLLFSSCKKNPIEGGPTIPIVSPGSPDTTKNTPSPIIYKRTVMVGTGSGTVSIDGSTMDLKCDDLIKIKGGTYTNINIKNILSADGCPITIKNDGLVDITGDFSEMSLTNLKNVIISGDGTAGISKGFSFHDNSYRAVQIWGSLDKFTLQYISFRNIRDMNISFPYNKVYDGSDASFSKDLKFLHISCDNTSLLLGTGGLIENGVIQGLIKNIEIADIDFQNSPDVGTVVYMGNVENYDIHNNKINNINTNNNNHNGIFQLAGNGKFYNNYISNHQGNAIRAWGHTVGSTPKYIYIYNNIVINSRKYSGFEVQAFDRNIVPGKSTYTNAVVFNNTCGNLNTSNDWQGNVVDVYSLKGGKCDVYNNLAYNFQDSGTIAGQESDLIPTAYNNLYFKTSKSAGLVDETSLRLSSNSPAKNAGIATPFLISDYYGLPRNAVKPSIGAVE